MPPASSNARPKVAPFVSGLVLAAAGCAWLWWGGTGWMPWTTIVLGAALAGFAYYSGVRWRAPRPDDVPGDYRVSDEMLDARFAHLGEGDRADEWRDFLAQREPGDQLWYVHDMPGNAEVRAGAEYLILMRPYPDDTLEPIAPGGEEVARYMTKIY